MEALKKDFQDLVDSEEVLQEDGADETSPTDLSAEASTDESSSDDELISEKSEAQEVVDKVLSEEDTEDTTEEQQEITEKEKKESTTAVDVDTVRTEVLQKVSQMSTSYDPSADVTALIGDSELSEEFKTKASTIFEAAVTREVESRTKQFDENLSGILVECTEGILDNLTEKVDSYLDYVVEEWMQENEIAIDSGIRSELTEDFIVGLKTLFTEHYVDIPDDKVDVLGELASKVEELEEKLNTQINENIELKKEVSSTKRDELVRGISADLVETEVEKLKELSEGIEYNGDDEEFTSKLETLCESYFPKGKVDSPVTDEPVILNEEKDLNKSMSAYTNAISRTNQSSRV